MLIVSPRYMLIQHVDSHDGDDERTCLNLLIFLTFLKLQQNATPKFPRNSNRVLTEQNQRKPETCHKKVERSEQSDEEDEFIEVELESDEELKQRKARKEQNSYCSSFPSSSDSDSEKYQKAIDSKKFAAQSTLNLFRNLASIPTAAARSTMTAFTPYAMNCQLNNALQYAEQ